MSRDPDCLNYKRCLDLYSLGAGDSFDCEGCSHREKGQNHFTIVDLVESVARLVAIVQPDVHEQLSRVPG